MGDAYVEAPGRPVDRARLEASKAVALFDAIGAFGWPFVSVVECRRSEQHDIVVLDVEVQLPREPAAPIQRMERVAVAFDRQEDQIPLFLALRAGFPCTSHQNATDRPQRDLCLFEEDYEDLKKRWTPFLLLHRLREWLRLTAKGQLHGSDQPLEPFIQSPRESLVVPQDVFEREDALQEPLVLVGVNDNPIVLVAESVAALGQAAEGSSKRLIAAAIKCPPREHGVMYGLPQDLGRLERILRGDDFCLITELRCRLREWHGKKGDEVLAMKLVLVVWVPKTRSSDTGIEATDVRGFLFSKTLLEIGQDVGAWEVFEGRAVPIVGQDSSNERRGENTPIGAVRVAFTLDREKAAWLNRARLPSWRLVSAIGMGALGSQVAVSLTRAGCGSWVLIDDDVLLPHNLARHALPGAMVGDSKARATALWIESTLQDAKARFLATNLLRPRADLRDQVESSLKDASLILDMSASAAVCRRLALETDAEGRRVSLFLSPTGRDLVMLAEDESRSYRLDFLEAQFYRELLDDELGPSFGLGSGRMRYGQTCRDVTAQIPQSLVGMHAGIAAAAVLALEETLGPRIAIWHAGSDGSVRLREVAPSPWRAGASGGWQVMLDDRVIHEFEKLRNERLPCETGGVLMGNVDLENKIVYLLMALPSPPDSEESRSSYLRGTSQLPSEVRDLESKSDGVVGYVGEWHSHPRGVGTSLSDADKTLFGWLHGFVDPLGLPAVMGVAGDDGVRMFVGETGEGSLFRWSDSASGK